MPAIEKRTVSLPHEPAKYINMLVESGGYASASEVVRAGLRALQERDAAMKQWLIDEVVAIYDAMIADPGRERSADQVAERLRNHHAQKPANVSRSA